MAHQAHNIPWTLLASHLNWRPRCACQSDLDQPSFYPRFKPHQAADLRHFSEAFVRNIHDHSATERRKLPETFIPPELEEVVIDDALAAKIGPSVHRVRRRIEVESYGRTSMNKVEPVYTKKLCDHRHRQPRLPRREYRHTEDEDGCSCALPYRERQAAAFLRPYVADDCYRFWEDNGYAFLNLQIVETLLMHGEMELLLRACSHPDNKLQDWWERGLCWDSNIGWDRLIWHTLTSYILLNVIQHFPSTWDTSSGRTPATDYRHTKAYQCTLRYCTLSGSINEVLTMPHKQFFGIADGQFSESYQLREPKRWAFLDVREDMKPGYPRYHSLGRFNRYPYGFLPFDEFLDLENCDGENGKRADFQPHVKDVQHVRWMLCQKGLPLEMAMQIMDAADYVPTRRMEVPHDPFHSKNWEELDRYLKFCWIILVRCDLLACASGIEIPWKNMVVECLGFLFGCRGSCRMGSWYAYEYRDRPIWYFR